MFLATGVSPPTRCQDLDRGVVQGIRVVRSGMLPPRGSGSCRIDQCSDPQANRNGLARSLGLLSGLGDEPILGPDPFRAAHATHRAQFVRIGAAFLIKNIVPKVNTAHQAVDQ